MFNKLTITTLLILFSSFGFIACSEDDSSTSTMTILGDDSAAAASVFLTSPSSLKINVYEAWVSTSGDCSNPVKIYDAGATPAYQDFVPGVTIGQGSVANGTYNCMIMVMSDNIKHTPSANDGAQCVAGTEYTQDVCNAGYGASFTLPDGTTGTCNDTEQIVAVYLSTYASATTGGSSNSFLPPTTNGDTTKGLNLGAALNVTGNTSNTFVVDVTNKIDGSGSSCEMMPPNFSFQ